MDTRKIIILRCIILHFNSTFKLPTHQRSQDTSVRQVIISIPISQKSHLRQSLTDCPRTRTQRLWDKAGNVSQKPADSQFNGFITFKPFQETAEQHLRGNGGSLIPLNILKWNSQTILSTFPRDGKVDSLGLCVSVHTSTLLPGKAFSTALADVGLSHRAIMRSNVIGHPVFSLEPQATHRTRVRLFARV